jgi:hypothetical protein
MNASRAATADPTSLQNTLFPITSRYHGLDIATLETVQRKTIVYLRRRFIPPPERFQLLQEHTVTQGERLDNIAAQYLGDPERFWQLCDANNAMQPEELTQTLGRRLRITLPEGMQAPSNA